MIQLVDRSFEAPEANLAFDLALLQDVEQAGGCSAGFLRVWESPVHFVVLGHAGKLHDEVDTAACLAARVPVLRRATGGGAVLQGPGCLSFALALSLDAHPPLRDVRRSLRLILATLRDALQVDDLETRGLSDLAVRDKKVSGNAQRRTQRALLHHGTLLYGLDVSLVQRLLHEPLRQPDYRHGRRHADFLGRLPLAASEIRGRLVACWDQAWQRQHR